MDLLNAGKTHVSQIAMLASNITQANADKILTFLPGATNEDVLSDALDELLSKIDPIEKAKRAEKKVNKENSDVPFACPGAVSKTIPAKTKHLLFANKPQCAFTSWNGKRCEATTHLQIDHIQMRCRGGTNKISNLRLLCAEHNLLEAERHLGKKYISDKILQSVVLN
jgi:hypothetical protein